MPTLNNQEIYTGPLNPGNIPGALDDYLNIVGLCDVQLRSSKNAIKPFRFGTLAIRTTLAGAGPFTLTVPAGTEASCFTKGTSETVAIGNSTGLLTLDDTLTDAERQGALIAPGSVFIITGIECSAMPSSETESSSANATPGVSPVMFESDVGLLDERLREGLLSNCALTLEYTDTDCNYKLGIPLHWVSAMGAHGAVSNSSNRVPQGLYLPLFRSVVAVSRMATNQLSIKGTFPHAMIINFSGAVSDPSAVDMYLQIRVFGFPLCLGDVAEAAVEMTPEIQAMIAQATAQALMNLQGDPSAPTIG